MSYTNQTQYYRLPQYVGTDVPAWLTDINGAFAAIDAGMNAAKVQADGAAATAGQAANDITALQSTVGTQAEQISAAAQAAATAQSTANTADGKADTNAQSISGLDTRVTSLEGLLVKERVTITNNYFITIPAKSGYIPVFADVITTDQNAVSALIGYYAAAGVNIVECYTSSSGSTITIATGNHTLDVYYIKVSA